MSGEEDDAGLVPVLETVSDADMAVTISLVEAEKQLQSRSEQLSRSHDELKQQRHAVKTPDKKSRASTSKSGGNWPTAVSLGSSKMLWTDWIDSIRKDALTPSKKNNHPHMGLHHLEAIESVLLMWERDLQRREADASVPRASISSKGSSAKGRKKSRDEREGSPLKKARTANAAAWSGSDDERPPSLRTSPGPVTHYSLQWAQQNRSKASVKSAAVSSSLNSITTLLQTVPRPLHSSLSHVAVDSTSSSSATPTPTASDTASQAASEEGDMSGDAAAPQGATQDVQDAEREEDSHELSPPLPLQIEKEKQRFVFCASDGPSSSAASGEEDNSTYDADAGLQIREHEAVPAVLVTDRGVANTGATEAEPEAGQVMSNRDSQVTAVSVPEVTVGDVQADLHEEEDDYHSGLAATRSVDQVLQPAAADVSLHETAAPAPHAARAEDSAVAMMLHQQQPTTLDARATDTSSDPYSRVAAAQLEREWDPVPEPDFEPELESPAFHHVDPDHLHAESADGRWGQPASELDEHMSGTPREVPAAGDESEEEVIRTSYCMADSAQESYDTVVIKDDHEEDVDYVESLPRAVARMMLLDAAGPVAYVEQLAADQGVAYEGACRLAGHVDIEDTEALVDDIHVEQRGYDVEDGDLTACLPAYVMAREQGYDEVDHGGCAESDVISPPARALMHDESHSKWQPGTDVEDVTPSYTARTFTHDDVHSEHYPVRDVEEDDFTPSHPALNPEDDEVHSAAEEDVREYEHDVPELAATMADSASPEDMLTVIHPPIIAHDYPAQPKDSIPVTELEVTHKLEEEDVAIEAVDTSQPLKDDGAVPHSVADSAELDFPFSSSVTGPSDISTNVTPSLPPAPSTSYSPTPSHDPIPADIMNSSPESIIIIPETTQQQPFSPAYDQHERAAVMSDSLSLDEDKLPLTPTELPTPLSSNAAAAQAKHQRVFSVPTPRSGCGFNVPEDFWELPFGQQGTQQVPAAPLPPAVRTAPASDTKHGEVVEGSPGSLLWSLPSNAWGLGAAGSEAIKTGEMDEDEGVAFTSAEAVRPSDVRMKDGDEGGAAFMSKPVQQQVNVSSAPVQAEDELRREVEQAGGRLQEETAVDFSALIASQGLAQSDATGHTAGQELVDFKDSFVQNESVPGVWDEQEGYEPVSSLCPGKLLSVVAEEEEGAFSDATRTGSRLESKEVAAALDSISAAESIDAQDARPPEPAMQLLSGSGVAQGVGGPQSGSEQQTDAEEENKTSASQVSAELQYISAHASPLSSLSVGQHQYLSEPWAQRVAAAQVEAGSTSSTADLTVATITSPTTTRQVLSPVQASGITVDTRPPTRIPSGDSIHSNTLTSPPSSGRRYLFAGRTIASLPSSIAGSEGWDDMHVGPGASMKLSLSDLTLVIDGEVAEKEQENRKNVLATLHSIHSLHTGASDKLRLVNQDSTEGDEEAGELAGDMAVSMQADRGVNSMVLAAGLTTVDYAQALKDMGLAGQEEEDEGLTDSRPVEAGPSAALLTGGDQSDVVDERETKLNILEDSLLPLEQNFLPMAPFGLYALKSGNSELLTGGSGLYALPMSPMAGSSARSERLKSTGAESSDGSQRGRAGRRSTWAVEGNSPSSSSSAAASASQSKVSAASPSQREPWAAAFTMVEPEQAKPPPRFTSATRPPSQYRLRSASPSASRGTPTNVPPRSASAPRPAPKSRVDASRDAKPGTPSRAKSAALTASNLSRIPTSPWSSASPRKSWDSSVRTSSTTPTPRASQSSLRSSLPSPRSSTAQSPAHRRTASTPQSPSVSKTRKPAAPRPAWRPVVTPLPPRSLQERKQEVAAARAAAEAAAKQEAAARDAAAKAAAKPTTSRVPALPLNRKLLSVESDGATSNQGDVTNPRLLVSSPGDLMTGKEEAQSEVGSGSGSGYALLVASSPEIALQAGRSASATKEKLAGSPAPSSVCSFVTASSPRIAASSPRVSAASPRVSASSPRVTAASPRISAALARISSPRVSTASPRVSSPSPRVLSPSPRVPAASPHISSSSPRLRQPSPRRSLSDVSSLPLKEPLHTGAGFRSTGSQPSAASNDEALFSQELGTPVYDQKKTTATTPNRSNWSTPAKPPAGKGATNSSSPSLISTLAAAAGRPQWDLRAQEQSSTERKLSERRSPMSSDAVRQSYPGANQAKATKHKLWALADDAHQDDWLMSPDEAAKPGPLHSSQPESPIQAMALEEGDEALQALRAAEKRMSFLDMDTGAPERQNSAGSTRGLPATLSAQQERRTSLLAEVSRSLPEFPPTSSTPPAPVALSTMSPPLTAWAVSPAKPALSPFSKPVTTPPHRIPDSRVPARLADPILDLSPRWKLRLLPRFRDRGMRTTVEAPAALGGSSQPKEGGGRFAARKVKSEGDADPNSPRLRHFNNMVQLQLSLSSLKRVKSGGSVSRKLPTGAVTPSAPGTPANSSISATPAAVTPAATSFRVRPDSATTQAKPSVATSLQFSSSSTAALTVSKAGMPNLPALATTASNNATSISVIDAAARHAPNMPAVTAPSSARRAPAAGMLQQVLSPTATIHTGITSPASSSTAPRFSTIREDQILSADELAKVDPLSPTPQQKPILDTSSTADFEPLWGFGGATPAGATPPASESGASGKAPSGLPPLKTSEWQGMPFDEASTVSKPTVRQGNYLVLNTEGTDVEEEMWSTGVGYTGVATQEAVQSDKEPTFFFRQAQEESLAMQMRKESEALKEKERARLAKEQDQLQRDILVKEEAAGMRESVSALPPQPPSARRISANETVDALAGMPDAALSSRLLRQRTSGSTAMEDDTRPELDQASAVSAAVPPSTPSFTAPPRPLLASPPPSEDISLPPGLPSAVPVVHAAVPPVNIRPLPAPPSATPVPEPVELTPAPLSSAHLNALQETMTAQASNGNNVQDSILQWITDAAYAQDTSSMELAMQLAQLYFPEPPLETIHEESAEYRSSTRSSPSPTPTVKEATALYSQPMSVERERYPYRESRPSSEGPSVKLLPPVGARVVQHPGPPPPPIMLQAPSPAVTRSEVAAAIAAISAGPMSLSSNAMAARGVAPSATGPPQGPRRVSLSGAMALVPETNYAPPTARMAAPVEHRTAGYYQSMPEAAAPSWDIETPIAVSKGTENTGVALSPERTVSPARHAGGKSDSGSGFGSRLRSRRGGGRSSSKGGSMDAGSSAEKTGKCRVQ